MSTCPQRRPTFMGAALLCLFAFACKNAAAPADAHRFMPRGGASPAVFVNGGFENGTLSGWSVATNLNKSGFTYPPGSTAGLNLGAGGNNYSSAVFGATETQIPAGLTASSTLRLPKYGSYSAVVNSKGASYNSNTITTTATMGSADVDAADGKIHVRFAVAPVLQNPGHPFSGQPYYYVQVVNNTRGLTLTSKLHYANEPGVPWKTDPGAAGILYTDWQIFDIAPGASQLDIGDSITVTVVASGCNQGGHWGEVYVDAFGSLLPGLSVAATAPVSVNQGANLAYKYNVKNGGTGTATNVIINQPVPASSTYVSADVSGIAGASCTAPASGSSTGTISCNLGTLSPAAGASFTITFNVPASVAVGSLISNGSYSVQGDGITPLIGPAINTSVTSNAVYADLAITGTDGKAAVLFGDPNAYTITVTNNGPSAVSAAPVSVPIPAQFVNAAWTCTPAAGSACGVASGTGAINTTVDLPSGGQAVFSLSGNIVAGSGSSSIRMTGSITVPSGITDSYPDNNQFSDTDSIGSLDAVTVSKTGNGTGRVVSSPAAIDCGSVCASASANFLDGTQVSFTATPDSGQTFAGWTSGCSGTVNPCSLTLSASVTVTASFLNLPPPSIASVTPGSGVAGDTVTINGSDFQQGAMVFLNGTLATLISVNANTIVFKVPKLAPGTYDVKVANPDAKSATQPQAFTYLAPSSVALASSANPQAFGAPVTVTATVSGGAATGTVTFFDGTANLGSGTLSGGTTILTTSTLTVGTHHLTAQYGGNGTLTASVSSVLSQSIIRATPAVSVSFSPSSPVYGESVTLSASVSGAGATPGGTATFFDGATSLGTVTLSSGAATLPVSTLPAGNHSITASYSGDPDFTAATSAASTLTIGQAATGASIAASPAAQTFGAVVTLTATISTLAPGNGAADGTATLVDGASVLGTATLSGGAATFSTSSLSVGSHSLTVTYGGSSNFLASSSSAVVETIIQGTPMVTLAIAPATGSSVWGQSAQLTATVAGPGATASGSVIFTEGSSPVGTGTLSGGVATFSTGSFAVGSHTITANYTGDGNFVAASSAGKVLTVSQAASSTTIAASPQPSTFGAAVTLTATVAALAPGSGTVDGTVTFFDGAASLGTASLSAGTAALPVSSLSVGSHSLTATFGGSTNFTASTSQPANQTVDKATPAAVLTFSPAAPVYGETVTFTATVSGPGGTPTGSVILSDGTATLGTASLGGGVIAFQVSTLAVGAHTLSAAYGGDGNFVAASSAGTAVTIQQAATTTALTAASQPSTFGAAVALSATVAAVAPGAGTPGGTVTFLDGTTSLGTAALSAGIATISISSLPVGPHSLTATYGGDPGFLASTSSATSQYVSQAQASVALAAAPTATVYGQSLTLTATVTGPGATPTGSVTFLDGTQSIGTAQLAAGAATLQLSRLAVGGHSLTASYAGDGSFLAAASAAVPLTVGQAASAAAMVVDITPSVTGQKITITAGVSAAAPGAGVPGGTLTFNDGTAALGTAQLDAAGTATFSTAALAVGVHPLTVVYGGDTNFTGSTSSPVYSQSVTQAATTLALKSDSATPVFSQPVLYTATVSTTAPGSGIATGAVTFTDGTLVLGTAQLDAAGVATLTDATLAPGAHTVTATYAGDNSFSGSTDKLTETVGVASTTTALSISPNPSSYGTTVVFTAAVNPVAPATGTPGGTVTFFDGAAVLGTGVLDGPSAMFSTSSLLAGSHVITASYGGDNNFQGSSPEATTTLVVNRAPTAVSIATVAPASSVTGQQVTISVAVASVGGVPFAGRVSLYDGATTGAEIGSAPLIEGGATITVAFQHAGTHPLTAVYSGDANFLGSTSSPARNYVVTPAATSVAVSASPSQTFVNRPITFRALVSTTAPGAGTPGGTVAFSDAGLPLGTATLDASGAASLTVASLAFGNHPITASYAGSPDYRPSQGSLAGGETIQKSAPVAGSGTAVAFDGATQSAVAANAGGELDSAHTVEVSFNRAASDVPHGAACLVQQGEGSATVFGLCLTAARDGLEVRRGSDKQRVAVDLGPGWHHLALVAGDATLVYVDGLQIASLAGGFGRGTGQPLAIAAAPAGTGRTDRFAGAIDELRLWSIPRGGTDVEADRLRPVADGAAGLLAVWRLDEGAGAALYDAGPRHAVATLEGAPAWVASEAWKHRTTPEERPLAAFTAGYDPDGAPITVALATPPPHGTASPAAERIGYLPAPDFLGTDAFTYSVSNGQSSSSVFTTEVAVTHIDVCSAQSDCGGGDLCTNSRCVGPVALSSLSGGCSSLPSSGPSTALLPLVLLGFLLLRRRAQQLAPAGMLTLAARKLTLLLLPLLLSLGAAQARAADGFALDTYEPSPEGDRFFAVPDATVEGSLTPAFGVQLGWAHAPLTLYSGGTAVQQGRLVEDQLAMRLGGAIPLFDRVLLDADISMSVWQRGQTPFNGQQSLSASAFRDPRLGARVALLRGEELSLAAGLDLFVPIGSQAGYGSDGGFRALPQALASGRRGRLVYAGEVGLELRKRADVSFTTTGSALRLGLAGGWLFLNDKLQVGPELFSSVQLNDASRTSLEALLGARYQRGDFNFGAGIGGRLNQHAPGAAPVRVLAQITFTGFDPFRARARPFVAAPVVVAAAPVVALAPPAPPVVVAEPPPAPKPVELAVAPPPPPEPAPAPPQDVRILEDHIELLHALRFENDSAVLDEQSQADLSKLAEALLGRPDIKRVFVSGHSDNRGSASHNGKLTARRADAVRAHLVAHGVPAAMLKAKGCGSKSPLAPNETDEGRAQNRRVEIVFPADGVEPGCTK